MSKIVVAPDELAVTIHTLLAGYLLKKTIFYENMITLVRSSQIQQILINMSWSQGIRKFLLCLLSVL